MTTLAAKARRMILILLIFGLVLATIPSEVAAQETQSGNTVIIEQNETTEGFSAMGGTVIIRGTVDGDLDVFAGTVLIAETGEVTGTLTAFAGDVRIAGTIGGDATIVAGNVFLDRSGSVEGTFEAAGGSALIGGTVGNDAEIGASSITLGPAATIGGNFAYDGALIREAGATVQGTVERTDDLMIEPGIRGAAFPIVPGWAAVIYSLLVNCLLGAVLLIAFPTFSRDVTRRIARTPVRSAGVGFLAIVGVPVGLVLIGLTLVGLPLMVIGALVIVVLAWAGSVYGRFAVGMWLLSLTSIESRWIGLIVGVVAVGLMSLLPIVGSVLDFGVFLLGVGAIVYGLRARRQGHRDSATPVSSVTTDVPKGRPL